MGQRRSLPALLFSRHELARSMSPTLLFTVLRPLVAAVMCARRALDTHIIQFYSVLYNTCVRWPICQTSTAQGCHHHHHHHYHHFKLVVIIIIIIILSVSSVVYQTRVLFTHHDNDATRGICKIRINYGAGARHQRGDTALDSRRHRPLQAHTHKLCTTHTSTHVLENSLC